MQLRLGGWIAGLIIAVLWAAQVVYAAALDPVPVQTGLLVDQAGVLSVDARAHFEAKLQAIQKSGRAQVAVLISSGIHDEALAAYSLRVAEEWRLGHAKRDDGLLILVVPSLNKARIEVGYGLEGNIPDARASKWISEFLPALKNNDLPAGLDALIDNIDHALPAIVAKPDPIRKLIDANPEWKLPFVIMLFSPFALFPMLFSGIFTFGGFSSESRPKSLFSGGSIASGLLIAAFAGAAGGILWGATAPTYVAAGVAFMLPLMWGLNFGDGAALSRGLQFARALGNILAVALFFTIVTVAVGLALYLEGDTHYLATPLFGAAFALGLAVFLYPQSKWLRIVMGIYLYYLFISVVVYAAMKVFNPEPAAIAFSVAGILTTLGALTVYLNDREHARAAPGVKQIRWSLWLTGLIILIILPFGIVLLIQMMVGEEFYTRLMHAAAGGGSIAGVLWWAAGVGFFTSLRVGLGGLFGGGGAGD